MTTSTSNFSHAKVAILLAAERLFSDYGINGVSMRQISSAAGSKNTYAAQFHFGNKDNIVDAIMLYRRPLDDELRADFICRHGNSLRTLTTEQLIEAIFYPYMVDPENDRRRVYCRFLSSLMHYDASERFWIKTAHVVPVTTSIYEELRGRFNWLSDRVWLFRSLTLTRYLIDVVSNYGYEVDMGGLEPDDFRREVISVIAAGLHAPNSSA